MGVRTAQDELQDLQGKSTRQFTEDILRLIAIKFELPNLDRKNAALAEIADTISATKGVADMLGSRRVLLQMEARKRRYGISQDREESAFFVAPTGPSPLVPRIQFKEAIDDLVSRSATVVRDSMLSRATQVSQLYTQQHGFALAFSTDTLVTERVQDYIAGFLREGKDIPKVEKAISDLGPWAESYGRTVFRTNVSTAYSFGTLQMASDPDVADFVVGLIRKAILDPDARANHREAHNLRGPVPSAIWLDHGVPGGYNCRCDWEIVDRVQAKRNGWLDQNGNLIETPPSPAARNDPGFTGQTNTTRFLGGGF